ncbi:hypothetical protein [Nocardioides sp. LML1-1-1.1]|uniref:hypothetical protein n=1 Tax=Nocardioides sp. LML1-1-1.1 TaxID=3135248 RepID=UPI003446439C
MERLAFVPTERWGEDLYGHPCRECAYSWDLTVTEAVQLVDGLPSAFRELLDGSTGRERHTDLAWGPVAYVCHVGDNLRAWTEGLSAGLENPSLVPVPVPGYDPDLLAEAKRYHLVVPEAALWSLTSAVVAWTEVVPRAVQEQVSLWHARRGEQRAEDVARNNAHDALHHVWDVRRILAASRGT